MREEERCDESHEDIEGKRVSLLWGKISEARESWERKGMGDRYSEARERGEKKRKGKSARERKREKDT
eukprot:1348739-Amorphochlora_amoeboformis.AAC.2